jgi:acetolactate decarboxylase
MQDQTNDTIYFVSLNHAVHEGQYAGITTVDALKEYGDFGIGSEDRLAGEMVLLDGVFYSIPGNGRARRMDDADKIAYGAVKEFKADDSFSIDGMTNLEKLETLLGEKIHPNQFAAIRVDAEFESIDYRSFEEQTEPFKPVDDVQEIMFNRKNLEGTIVGFYTPESANVLNSPKFHFHFIDKARTTGGHVHDFRLKKASVQIDVATELHILLPPVEATDHVDLDKPSKPKG